jgi:4-diphosphocytidyl-2-C-methyl-D-erythritol kinase
VLDRRADDGYHDLHTVFQALALHDTLTCLPRSGPFAIESGDPGLPLDGRNLVWRAADLLWAHLRRPGSPADVLVHVEKCIPMKGGLGGGSADAAAALVALARLWDADVPADELVSLGRRLGADVAFFFTGGAALGLGRGDELYPLADLPRLGVLLVIPRFDVSTADAYRWIDELRAGAEAGGTGPERAGREESGRIPRCSWQPPACEVANDFEAVVAGRHPELEVIKQALRQAGATVAAMTGSGSTVFGLFEDEQALPAAAQMLRHFGQPMLTHTLTRAEYLESSTPEER